MSLTCQVRKAVSVHFDFTSWHQMPTWSSGHFCLLPGCWWAPVRSAMRALARPVLRLTFMFGIAVASHQLNSGPRDTLTPVNSVLTLQQHSAM
jgi:hypothetical protein